ncbi:hypothetical protein A9G36_02520 [Gilliamella sp. Choc6-1]|jgi:hypothetical protein|uniref:SMI1/KNR4 family protein n=1 Tax=Gilliamella sp. Choc6-1 TaxID=3120239 RepID=UPI00080DE54D|nr:SMI1/KNR4 family protein [Gilliamella apicola]OCG56726.1 hypothetical protein A9G36_02520 [Gilliamella apicola]
MIDLKLINSFKEPVDRDFLDNYIFGNNREFPNSYKDFAINYGYGLLCNLFLIYIPMENYCDSWQNQFKFMKQLFSEYIDNEWYLTLDPDGDIVLMRDAVPFAKSENGEFLFWNINSKSKNNEFDIYITDFKGLGVVKIAETLDEFVYKITHAGDYPETKYFISNSLPAEFKSILR